MSNVRPFITRESIEALGYSFNNPAEESMFLDFANDLFAKTVGSALLEQLPEAEADRLRHQKDLSEEQILQVLSENHVDSDKAVEEVWEDFRIALLNKKYDVMRLVKKKSTSLDKNL